MKAKQTTQAFGLSLLTTVIVNAFMAFSNQATGTQVTVGNVAAKRTFALLWVVVSILLAVLVAVAAYALGSYAIDSGSLLAYAGTFALIFITLKFLWNVQKAWKKL